MNLNTLMVILLCVALLAILTGAAHARQSIYFCVVELNKCMTVTLPKPGKCKTVTFHGRKIKLCASEGEGRA